MCGRYIVSDESSQMRTYLQITNINSGDVYPASMAPVLMDQNDNLTPKAVKWGVNGFKKSSVIINARAETALEKKKKSRRKAKLAATCLSHMKKIFLHFG